MSFTDNFLKALQDKGVGTANIAGGTTPSASSESSDTHSGKSSYTSNFLSALEKRNNMTISERAAERAQTLLKEQRDRARTPEGIFRNAAQNRTGLTTSGGYYSRPAFGSASEKLYSNLTALEPVLTQKRSTVETAQTSLQQARTDLNTMQGHLDQARAAYDADPTEANANSYNQIVSAYNLAYDACTSAYDAYSAAYDDYRTYENRMVDALAMYQIYNDQQQKDFDSWKGTIRESGAVQEDIARIEEELAKARENKRDLENLQKQYKEQLGESYTNRLAGYEKQITQLENALELAQEELGWSQYYYYAGMTDASDFAEKSQYVSTANGGGRSWLDIMLDRYDSDNSGWDDPLYEYINGNEEAGAYISNAAANSYGSDNAIGAVYGRATESKTESQQMDEQEVATFNYLYATQGKEAAYAYYNYLLEDLNYRQRQADEAYWAEYAAKHPVGSSVLSVAMSPTKGLSYIGQLTDYLQDGKIDQNAAYNKFSYAPNAMRGQVAQQIEASGKWGKVGSFAYQTGLSMADFLLNTAIAGGNEAATLVIMGSGAAADATISAKDRGLTDTQSFLLGTIAGAAEIITEKVSLETLLDPGLLKNGAAKYVLKNMLAEGSEEVGSDLINLIADIIIAKDQSEWQSSIDYYTAQGKTEAEAFGLAIADQAATMGLDFLGGAISGGILSGVNAGIHVNYTNQMGNDLNGMNLNAEDIQAFIETGLESDPETASYQLAVEMQEKIEAGKELTGYDLARLWQANMQAIQEEESAGKLPDDTIVEGEQTEMASGEDVEPGGLSLPTPEESRIAIEDGRAGTVADNVTDSTLQLPSLESNAQTHDAARSADAPLSIADQLRREQAQNGGIKNESTYERTAGSAETRPAGAAYVTGGTNVPDGGAERNNGTGAAEQAGGMAGSAEQRRSAWTDRNRATVARQNYARSLRLEKVSSLDLGLQNGTEARNIQIMPKESWDAEMARLADRIYNETGKDVTYVMGRIQIRGSGGAVSYARGVITGDQIIVQADNLRIPMEQIADHEAYHAKADFTDGRLNGEIRRYIVENFSEEQFRQVLDKYIEGLRGVIDVNETHSGAEFEAAVRQIEEEIFADAYAGINAFGAGGDQFTDAVNERMDQLYMGKIRSQDNGTETPTGPPTDRYSYAGENANNADLDALERAKEMHSAGVADETIRQQTGWHTGMDGKWRWEIDDSGMRYDSSGDFRGAESAKWAMEDYESARDELWSHADMDTLDKVRAYNRADIAGDLATKEELYDELINGAHAYYFDQYVEAMTRAKETRNAPAGGTLQDYIDHPTLFEAYPQLRNVTLRFERMGGGIMGYYSQAENEIVLNTELRYAAEDTLVHEIQHAIQDAEGFARGSNEEYWKQRQSGDNAVRVYDTKIQAAEKKVSEIMSQLPENVAEQFRQWSAMDDSSSQAMELAQELGDGPYADLFNDYFMTTWGLDEMRSYNHKRGSKDLYRNTAGEIEARDVTARRNLAPEQRRSQEPARGDSNTVFAEEFDDQSFAEMDAEYGPRMQSYFDPDVATEEIDSNIQRVAQMDPVTQISGEEFAKGAKDLTTQVEEFFAQIGNSAYNEQLGDVVLDRRGIKSDIAHGVGRKKAAAFAAVPDVIERGLVVDYQQNWKGRGYDTAVVAAPITIGTEEHLAAVVLTRSNQTNRFYVHEVLTTKDGAMPFKTGTLNKGTPGGDAPSVLSILDGIRSVKNQNEVADRFSVDDEQTGSSIPNTGVQQQINDLMNQYQEAVARGDRTQVEEISGKLTQALRKTMPQKKAAEQRDTTAARKKTRPVAESLPLIAKKDLRNTVLNLFSTPDGQRAEIGTMIDSYADRLLKNGSLTEDDRQTFFDRMYDAGVMVMPAEEYNAFARSHIVDGRIYVSDSVKADFGDDWADIRRRAFAAGVYLVNDKTAAGIDQWNATLSAEDMLPGLFDSEETDERTILERIMQVAEEGKDEHLSLAEYTRRLSQQEGISEDEFLDNMERQLDWALRTFAEKASLEVHLRDRTGRKIAQERERGAERLTRQRARETQRRADERQARKDSSRRARERRELRELQQRTMKQLQWLSKNRNRAPEELRATWDEVLGDIDIYAISAADEMRWSEKHNATWQDLAQMYKDAMKNDPNFLPSKELERIVARLDTTKIADMDLGALQDLYKAAIGLRTEFYNRNNVINDDMHRLFAEVYTDAKQEIENAPGKYTGKTADKLLNLQQLTAMNVMQRMGGWDPDGAFFSMAKQLERGERDVRAYKVKASRMLESFLTENADWVKTADGQGKDAVWYKIEIPELIALELGKKPEFGKTITVWMTPAQKVHMYLESKNVDNLRHMTGGRTFADKELYSAGKRSEAFAQGTTVRMAPETVKAIVSDLTPQELELAGLLERYYNSFATSEINRVSNALYGYDKAMGKNYAPIYTNRNYTKTEFGVFDTTAEGVGNLKGRQYAVNPSYNIGAFDAFEKHMDQTGRFVGMAIPTRNWTTLMNWRVSKNSTADVITHKWGEEGKSYITDLITTLQEGGGSQSDVVQSGIEKLRSNYISAVFGANPSIVLKQLGSIPLAAAYLDAKNFPSVRQIAGIDRQLIGQYTQDLEWRTMGYSMPETKTLKENPNWTQSNKVANFLVGGGSITAMDGWAASVLWPWAENKVAREFPELSRGTDAQIQNGQSPFYQKVAEEFENAVARSQSTSDEIHQGTLRKSKNPFTQVFTMFRSDSAQTYNVLRQKIGEAQYYARTGADAKTIRTARKAVGTAALSALIGYVWAEAVELLMNLWKHKGKSYRDDDGELTAESIAGEMVSGLVGDIAGIVVGGEELYDFLGGLLTDGTLYGVETMGLEQLNDCAEAMWYAGRGLLDVISDGADILKNGGNLGEYFRRHGNEMLGGVKDIANTAAMYISGFPTDNLEKYLLGGIKWLAPELQAGYEDLLSTPSKTDLAGLNGDVLTARVGDIMDNRGIATSEGTAQVLAQLYENGEKTAIFGDTPSSISINGEKRSLSAYQQQTYDKVWASVVSDGLDELVSTSAFSEADEKTRAKMLSNLYTYAAEQAKAELFDDYEMDSAAAKNMAIIASGATIAECITWNTITSEMKSGEKSAELASWDIPEAAKREIFRCKISDSREDGIAAFDAADLSFDQFLEAYSMYGQINGEDLKAGMKAVEFSHWVNAQGYTAEQAAVVKDELAYFSMTPASSSRYDDLVGSGMDPDDAYELTGALSELQPEDGTDEVSDLQKWRASVDFSDDVDDQLAALSVVMTDAQFQKAEIANSFGINPDTYVTFLEIKPQYDADGNGSYTQKEIQAAVDGLPGYYTKEQRAVLWQLASGSTSAKNNPYSRDVGQQVLDARAAAKEAAAQEQTGVTTDTTDGDSFSQELLNQLLGRG